MKEVLIGLGIVVAIGLISLVYSGNTSSSSVTIPKIFPTDGATDVSLEVTLNWSAKLENNEKYSFDLYFGDKPNPPLIAHDLKESRFHISNLKEKTIYYWKVVVKNEKGRVYESPVWKFITSTVKKTMTTAKNKTIRYLAISDKGGKTFIVDISNCSEPHIVGRVNEGGSIFVDDKNCMYVVNKEGLSVFDINDPHEPKKIGFVKFERGDYGRGIYVLEKYAYIAMDWRGISIYDVSDPSNPKKISNFRTHGRAWNVFVSKNLLYIADHSQGLTIIDVSNPKKPIEVSNIKIKEDRVYSWSVFVKGHYAYVGNGIKTGVTIIDVSTPSNPRIVARLSLSMCGDVKKIYIDGDYAYLVTSIALFVVNIKNPEKPSVIYKSYLNAHDVFVCNEYAYVACGGEGLVVLDMKDPRSPKKISYLNSGGIRVNDIYVDDKFIYVSDDMGLILISNAVENNLTFDKVSTLSNDVAHLSGIVVKDNIAYAIDDIKLYTIDISDSKYPKLVNSFYPINHSGLNNIKLIDDVALLTNYHEGIFAIDVSNIKSPRVIYQVKIAGRPVNMFVKDKYVFVVGDSVGLKVLHLSKNSAKIIGELKLPGTWTFSASVKGRYIYVIGNKGLFIVDFEKPTSMKLVKHININGNDIQIKDNFLYVLGGELVVFDISDPLNPKKVGSAKISGKKMKLWKNYLFISLAQAGIIVVDISHPTSPKLLSEIGWFSAYNVVAF